MSIAHYSAMVADSSARACSGRATMAYAVFMQRATTGQAPVEVIVPAARRMPLYRLINDPFKALQERRNLKATATMADLLRPQAAAA